MPPAPLRRVLMCATVLAAVTVGAVRAPAGESSAGAVVMTLEGEEAECWFLLNLCHAVTLADEDLATTPRTGATDALVFKQAGEAALHVVDAVTAARAIKRKHGGKRLPCFDHPECAFLGE